MNKPWKEEAHGNQHRDSGYQGMNVLQISEARFVSLGTVKTQIHSILQIFGMKSMNDVVKQLKLSRFDYIVETMRQGS